MCGIDNLAEQGRNRTGVPIPIFLKFMMWPITLRLFKELFGLPLNTGLLSEFLHTLCTEGIS